MLIKWRVGLTLGLGRSLMHGVAPHMCGRVASPLLGRGAGGRSPGYLIRLGWRPGRKCCFNLSASARSVASAIGSSTSTVAARRRVRIGGIRRQAPLSGVASALHLLRHRSCYAAGARTRTRLCADQLDMQCCPVGLRGPHPPVDRPPVAGERYNGLAAVLTSDCVRRGSGAGSHRAFGHALNVVGMEVRCDD